MTKPQTIQIFLPQGEPRGLRVAEIKNRIAVVTCIPRAKLKEAQKRKEVNRVGIYFLFGEDAASEPMVYIGEAEKVYERIKSHDKNKDFWNTAIVVTAKDDNFNKACVKLLEWHSYLQAKEINRYKLENEVQPLKSKVSEADEAYSLELFDNAVVLMSTLGYPIFESLNKKAELYYCHSKNVEASGKYIEEGFLVLAGSKATAEWKKSAAKWILAQREALVAKGVLIENYKQFIFKDNHLFSSPSTASAVLLGANSNGWIVWKNKDGKTLDEVKRK